MNLFCLRQKYKLFMTNLTNNELFYSSAIRFVVTIRWFAERKCFISSDVKKSLQL